MKVLVTILVGAFLSAATFIGFSQSGDQDRAAFVSTDTIPAGERAYAVFAGGCFWCVEADFDKLDGVVETISGYTGGTLDNPSYRDVVSETTGHFEAVRIGYDPRVVSYEELVEYLLRHVDPLDGGGQFCDRGPSYRTAIFVETDAERETAQAVINRAGEILNAKIETEILNLATFWPAEDYHQDYYQKNPVRYGYYRASCGRDRRIQKVWAASEGVGD